MQYRTVIFEGPNRAGKTTIAAALSEVSDVRRDFYSKGHAAKTPRAALEDAWNTLHGLRMSAGRIQKTDDDHMHALIDRFPLFSDPIYRPILESGGSPDLAKHEQRMLDMLHEEFNACLIYVMAAPEVIRERFEKMDPHHQVGKDGQYIDLINDKYIEQIDRYHELGRQGKLKIPIFVVYNQGDQVPEIIAGRVLEFLNTVYIDQGGF